MKYKIDDFEFFVKIERKFNKNTYLRVKDSKNILITTNFLMSDNSLIKLLDDNKKYILKMVDKRKKEENRKDKFYYLGNSYDIIFISNFDKVEMDSDKIYVKDEKMFNKWYKNEQINIYKSRLDICYNLFKEKIPYPNLKIRNMKTRWGVCNRKNCTITLNSKLLEYDIEKLDYVIIHELSHLIEFNHSSKFWNIVNSYCPEYKKIRRELRD